MGLGNDTFDPYFLKFSPKPYTQIYHIFRLLLLAKEAWSGKKFRDFGKHISPKEMGICDQFSKYHDIPRSCNYRNSVGCRNNTLWLCSTLFWRCFQYRWTAKWLRLHHQQTWEHHPSDQLFRPLSFLCSNLVIWRLGQFSEPVGLARLEQLWGYHRIA